MKYIKKLMLIFTILTLFVVTKNVYAAPTTTTTTGTTAGTAGTTTTTTTTAPTTTTTGTTTTGTGTTTTTSTTTTTPTTAGTSPSSNPGITTTTTTAVPGASSPSTGSGGLDPFSYDPNNADNPNVDIDEVAKHVNPIYNILLAIIVLAAVLALSIIGLKFITASAQEKAEYKQHLIPVATGIIIAALLFSVLTLLAKFAQIF